MNEGENYIWDLFIGALIMMNGINNFLNDDILIVGGGISGLFAGLLMDVPVFEKNEHPGGLLSSYCFNPSTGEKKHCKNRFNNHALFEIGGGHWIWGLQKNDYIYKKLSEFSRFKKYRRKSSVYLVDYDTFVPYPLQYHLKYLPREIRDAALDDLINSRKEVMRSIFDTITFDVFLQTTFGETLYKIFFGPYNNQYTDGLVYEIAPPRGTKTPNDINLILKGASESLTNSKIGYNYAFYYPTVGLGPLMWRLCKRIKCHLNSEVTNIDVDRQTVTINNSLEIKYRKLYTAFPLLKVLKLCGEKIDEFDPFVGVLVVNAIAKKGRKTPKEHWVYLSKTKTKFHRIGYYSNVDEMFLPKELRRSNYVSAYIEKTIRYGAMPCSIHKEASAIVDEVVELELLSDAQVYDVNFVEVAYTWKRVGSKWVENSIKFLLRNNIIPIGRYATWGLVEGIVESIKDVINKTYKRV